MPVRALRRSRRAWRGNSDYRQNPINARKGITTLTPTWADTALLHVCQNPINARKGITTYWPFYLDSMDVVVRILLMPVRALRPDQQLA